MNTCEGFVGFYPKGCLGSFRTN